MHQHSKTLLDPESLSPEKIKWNEENNGFGSGEHMASDPTKLRRPSSLEALFYQELLAPIRNFTSACGDDPEGRRKTQQMAQRFKKEIARYGYILTGNGVMMSFEQDIIYIEMSPAIQKAVFADMQILRRLWAS